MNKYICQVEGKDIRQVEVEADNIGEAAEKAKEQFEKDYGAQYDKVFVTDIEEDL